MEEPWQNCGYTTSPCRWTGTRLDRDEPPYRHDVFVLTHHPRAVLPLGGGTTFRFVTDGLTSALDRAFAAAGGRDVRRGGGVATIRDCLRAGLVDEMHIAVVPLLLGDGERLFENNAAAGYEVIEHVSTTLATHYRFRRSGTAR